MIANPCKIYRYIAMEIFDDHMLEEISINYLLWPKIKELSFIIHNGSGYASSLTRYAV